MFKCLNFYFQKFVACDLKFTTDNIEIITKETTFFLFMYMYIVMVFDNM